MRVIWIPIWMQKKSIFFPFTYWYVPWQRSAVSTLWVHLFNLFKLCLSINLRYKFSTEITTGMCTIWVVGIKQQFPLIQRCCLNTKFFKILYSVIKMAMNFYLWESQMSLMVFSYHRAILSHFFSPLGTQETSGITWLTYNLIFLQILLFCYFPIYLKNAKWNVMKIIRDTVILSSL